MAQDVLQRDIIALSEAKKWDEACEEWRLRTVWMSDEPQTCLCGHHPIKEICEVENRQNKNTAEVGNCCVNHFLGLGSEQIFASLRKAKKDAGASLNPETITLAHQRNVISTRDRDFYLDIWRKRSLSEKQLKWKLAINQKVIRQFIK